MVPFPVQDIDSAPGPKYSIIAPVPPLTVKIPATFKITSLGAVQPESFPVNFMLRINYSLVKLQKQQLFIIIL